MNDETRSSGMTGLEGYRLGKLSGQSQRALGDAAAAFSHRLLRPAPPSDDVDALIAENRTLRQQLAATQADLRELEGIYNRLKEWGLEASRVLSEHGLMKS